MQLLEAVELHRGETICFIGAGGKTSLMMRLTSECRSRKRRVLATTSTQMFDWQLRGCGDLILDSDEGRLLTKLKAVDETSLTVAAGLEFRDGGKVVGLSREFLDDVGRTGLFDNVLVEADGARGRSLKAPAVHEPVVPTSAACVLAVIGVEALGLPLTEKNVHRPLLAAEIAGQQIGSAITGSTVCKLIGHYRDTVRQIAPGSRFIPVINKVESPELLCQARMIARHLLPSSERVLITAALQPDSVLEVLS